MELQKLVTPKQWSVLEQNKITTLYDLITYTPVRFEKLIWVKNRSELENTSTYSIILAGKIIDYSFIRGKAKGVKATIFSEAVGRIVAFCFLPPKFIMRYLTQENQIYKIILRRANDFWTIISFGKYDASFSYTNSELLPVYPKQGKIDTRFMRSITQRLKSNDFILNFTGLLPQSLHTANIISLEPLHKPKSEEFFVETQQVWKEITLFLRLVELKFFLSQQELAPAKASSITKAIEEKVLRAHPYTLSNSQERVIKNFISKISYPKKIKPH